MDLNSIFKNASNAFLARNNNVAGKPHTINGGKCENVAEARKTHKTSKAEIEWVRHLERIKPDAVILHQALTLPLTGGGRYTPDILLIDPEKPGFDIWEVKGGYHGPGWEQGIERYRRAAFEWSSALMRFHIASKKKGVWKVEDFAK